MSPALSPPPGSLYPVPAWSMGPPRMPRATSVTCGFSRDGRMGDGVSLPVALRTLVPGHSLPVSLGTASPSDLAPQGTERTWI